MSQGPQDTYTINEHCLCYHGDLLYEARINDIRNYETQPTPTGKLGYHYRVHYKGWSKGHDEIVTYDRLMKKTQDNLQTVKMVRGKATVEETGSSKGRKASSGLQKRSKDAPAQPLTLSSRGLKRPREDDSDEPNIEMSLAVSDCLKRMLVDDFERTKNEQLVSLPRRPSAEEVLKEFEEYVKFAKPSCLRDPELLAPTVVTGLRIYFDRTLGKKNGLL